jgi:mannose-6-phosphate isomerase-like protein (cupin superfamily)
MDEPTMEPLSVYDLNSLHTSGSEAWKSLDVATVNGNAVRCRVMQDVTANWHVHDSSDELFLVISGTAYLDTERGTQKLDAGQLFVVPSGTRHRARVEGRATLLVIDDIR